MTKEEMKKKYAKEIKSISEVNKVDLGVGFDMFIFNAKTLSEAAAAAGADWYKGGSLDTIIKDFNAYKAQLPK